jgi:hypothetical protein
MWATSLRLYATYSVSFVEYARHAEQDIYIQSFCRSTKDAFADGHSWACKKTNSASYWKPSSDSLAVAAALQTGQLKRRPKAKRQRRVLQEQLDKR